MPKEKNMTKETIQRIYYCDVCNTITSQQDYFSDKEDIHLCTDCTVLIFKKFLRPNIPVHKIQEWVEKLTNSESDIIEPESDISMSSKKYRTLDSLDELTELADIDCLD
jgi:hypothetical protein